jgi:hypothetical protein
MAPCGPSWARIAPLKRATLDQGPEAGERGSVLVAVQAHGERREDGGKQRRGAEHDAYVRQ